VAPRGLSATAELLVRGIVGTQLFSAYNCSQDDTKICKEVRDSPDCRQLQADLDKLVLWAQKWQMEFNVDKCKVMHVGNTDDSSAYYMEGSELTKVICEKDLGVWISDDMKCSMQCMHAFNKPLEYWV